METAKRQHTSLPQRSCMLPFRGHTNFCPVPTLSLTSGNLESVVHSYNFGISNVYMNGIVQYVTFEDWLFWITISIWRWLCGSFYCVFSSIHGWMYPPMFSVPNLTTQLCFYMWPLRLFLGPVPPPFILSLFSVNACYSSSEWWSLPCLPPVFSSCYWSWPQQCKLHSKKTEKEIYKISFCVISL